MPYAVCYAYGAYPNMWLVHATHSDGRAAGADLKIQVAGYAYLPNIRWKIRKVRDDGLPDDWQEREADRFSNGEYEPTPWHDADWYQAKHGEHFAHLSLKQPGKIAFTEDATKGEADRQTIIAAGRYLKKHFGDVLGPDDIEALACEVSVAAGTCSLKITQDADEIEEVYVNGPNSCMSAGEEAYNGPCHPVRVYAGPDLALAYTGDPDDASGRCIVWPEKKVYGEIYGDCSRLQMLLKEEGYTHGRLYGARVRKIDADSYGYVMPYVDGISGAEVDGEFIKLGCGPLDTCSTDGVSNCGRFCDQCDNRVDDDDLSYVDDLGMSVCEDCLSSLTTYCELTEEHLSDSNHTFVEVIMMNAPWHIARDVQHPMTTVTASEDHPEVFYDEDRDEHWHVDHRAICLAISDLAVALCSPQLPLTLAA